MVTTAILQKAEFKELTFLLSLLPAGLPVSALSSSSKPTPMFQLFQQVPEVKWTLHEKRVLYKMKQFAATRWCVLISGETWKSAWGPLSVGWTPLVYPKGWV